MAAREAVALALLGRQHQAPTVGLAGVHVAASAVPLAACESEQQHVVILVRNKGLHMYQLDTHNMW